MKFDDKLQELLKEADIDRLAQQDSREVYGDEEVSDAQQADDAVRDEGYEMLYQALRKFYEYGYTGSADSNAEKVNQKVVSILNDLEVDDRDKDRLANALMSLILGQITRGHSDF